MNFKKRVNKINRGFVDLDGGDSVQFFSSPPVAGVCTPKGCADPAHPFPRMGEGRGVGGESVSRHKKTAQHGPWYTTGGHFCPLGGVCIADPAT